MRYLTKEEKIRINKLQKLTDKELFKTSTNWGFITQMKSEYAAIIADTEPENHTDMKYYPPQIRF